VQNIELYSLPTAPLRKVCNYKLFLMVQLANSKVQCFAL